MYVAEELAGDCLLEAVDYPVVVVSPHRHAVAVHHRRGNVPEDVHGFVVGLHPMQDVDLSWFSGSTASTRVQSSGRCSSSC